MNLTTPQVVIESLPSIDIANDFLSMLEQRFQDHIFRLAHECGDETFDITMQSDVKMTDDEAKWLLTMAQGFADGIMHERLEAAGCEACAKRAKLPLPATIISELAGDIKLTADWQRIVHAIYTAAGMPAPANAASLDVQHICYPWNVRITGLPCNVQLAWDALSRVNKTDATVKALKAIIADYEM